MPKPSFVVALVEDERHRMLVYRYLKRLGLSPRQITTKVSPSGQGSAEQWIRKTYATEVAAHRIRKAKGAVALIVAVDADTHTVQARLTQLQEALDDSRAVPVSNEEQIVRLVPKRNVETWILCLTECLVDEATDYKGNRSDWNLLIPEASAVLFQWTHQNANLPGRCIESLRTGVNELRQLRL